MPEPLDTTGLWATAGSAVLAAFGWLVVHLFSRDDKTDRRVSDVERRFEATLAAHEARHEKRIGDLWEAHTNALKDSQRGREHLLDRLAGCVTKDDLAATESRLGEILRTALHK